MIAQHSEEEQAEGRLSSVHGTDVAQYEQEWVLLHQPQKDEVFSDTTCRNPDRIHTLSGVLWAHFLGDLHVTPPEWRLLKEGKFHTLVNRKYSTMSRKSETVASHYPLTIPQGNAAISSRACFSIVLALHSSNSAAASVNVSLALSFLFLAL